MTTTKPKLYEYSVCPFCHKVKAILLFKKVPFDTVEVNPTNKKEIAFSTDYKKVPILIDKEGTQVNDSTAIMRHLDQQYAGNQVFETDPAKVEEENKWLSWSNEVLVKALPPVIYRTLGQSFTAFGYITKSGNFSWWQKTYIRLFGAFVMWIVGKKSAKKQKITNAEEHLIQSLDHFADGIQGKRFLGGDKPNGADLAIFGILHCIEDLPAFAIIKNNHNVYSWYKNIKEKCGA